MKSLASGYHLAVDEGEAYDFLSTLSIVKARGAATNNALGVVEMRLPAGFSPPPHIHHNEDEAFYLLSGRIEAQLGEQKIPAEQGAFLWLPRNVLHGFVVSADGPCMILTITTPAGFDGFVAEVGTPTTSIEMPEPREPDIPRRPGGGAGQGSGCRPRRARRWAGRSDGRGSRTAGRASRCRTHQAATPRAVPLSACE